jgi:Flp pilus assembly protein protease CpaA
MIYFLVIYGLIVSITDFFYNKIYNIVNIVFFLIFIILSFINSEVVYLNFLSAFIGFFIILPLYLLKIYRGGDLKLFFVLSYVVGYKDVFNFIILAIINSAILALVIVIIKGKFRDLYSKFYIFFISLFTAEFKVEFNNIFYVPVGFAICFSSILIYTGLVRGVLF